MGGGGQYRAEQGVIEAQFACPSNFCGRMAGRAHPGEIRAGRAGGEGVGAQVQAIGPDAAGELGIIIDHQQDAVAVGDTPYRFGKPQALCRGQGFVSQLDQSQPAGNGFFDALQLAFDAFAFSLGDGHAGRQRQGFQDRIIGRQDGGDTGGGTAGQPIDGAVFERGGDADFPFPGGYPPEIEAHGGVRVGELAGQPGRAFGDGDAEFFLQLADQRLAYRFAGFDLAAGELPVTGVDLAFWPLGEEKFSPVGAQHDGGGNFNNLAHAGSTRPA